MKILVLLAAFIFSTQTMALGNTDKSSIEGELSKLKSDGFDCKEEWREGFIMSQQPPNQKFSVILNCKKEGQVKKGTLIYQLDSNQYARCRDLRALSLEFHALTSELKGGSAAEAGT